MAQGSREVSIILPLQDNAGKDLTSAHAVLEAVLIETCGGFTTYAVNGAWREGRKTYRDSSLDYRAIATTEAIASLRSFVATQLLTMSRQKAILLTVRDVAVVDFVE